MENENIDYDKIIDEIADFIHKKKMHTPAILFLEMNKPLCLFFSSIFLVSTPVLGAFLTPSKMKKLYLLMEKRENIEKLIKKIESLEREK